MVTVKSVAASCVIIIKFFGTIGARQKVIGAIVKSFERECRALMVAFISVVKDNIKNNFNASFV